MRYQLDITVSSDDYQQISALESAFRDATRRTKTLEHPQVMLLVLSPAAVKQAFVLDVDKIYGDQ